MKGGKELLKSLGEAKHVWDTTIKAMDDILLLHQLLLLLQLDKSKGDEEDEEGDKRRKTFGEAILQDVVETRWLTESMSLHTVKKATSLVLLRRFDPFWQINETGTVSEYLLVKGNESDISSLTFVGTFLYQNARGMGDMDPFILGYFCSRHSPSPHFESEATQPVGLMFSILGQLVEQMLARGVQMDLEFLNDGYWEYFEERDLEGLGSVFHQLVLQLPRNSRLYCILDEVSCYDDHGTSDMMEILWELVDSVKLCKESGRVGFKLLVMTQRELDVKKLGEILKENIIDLADLTETGNTSQKFRALFGDNEQK